MKQTTNSYVMLDPDSKTLEEYAIKRLEAYRKEVEQLQEQIREQQDLLDEQGEVLQILDNYICLTSNSEFIDMKYISSESHDAKVIAECFGLTLKKGEKNEPES